MCKLDHEPSPEAKNYQGLLCPVCHPETMILFYSWQWGRTMVKFDFHHATGYYANVFQLIVVSWARTWQDCPNFIIPPVNYELNRCQSSQNKCWPHAPFSCFWSSFSHFQVSVYSAVWSLYYCPVTLQNHCGLVIAYGALVIFLQVIHWCSHVSADFGLVNPFGKCLKLILEYKWFKMAGIVAMSIVVLMFNYSGPPNFIGPNLKS